MRPGSAGVPARFRQGNEAGCLVYVEVDEASCLVFWQADKDVRAPRIYSFTGAPRWAEAYKPRISATAFRASCPSIATGRFSRTASIRS